MNGEALALNGLIIGAGIENRAAGLPSHRHVAPAALKGHFTDVAHRGELRHINVSDRADAVPLLLQDPRQFLGGIGHGPVVIGNGGLGLIGVLLPHQIRDAAVPDIGGVLCGAAVGSAVYHGVCGLAIVIDHFPRSVVHCTICQLRGPVAAIVHLTVRAGADVKAQRRMPGLGGVGAGAYCLCLQRRQRPVLVHFVGKNTLDIIFKIHHVDHRQGPVAVAAVFKAPCIFIALTPCLRVPAYRADAEAVAVVAEPVKDIAAFRFRDGHAVAGTGSPHGDGGFLRFVQINELPVLIVITEFIPGADGIFQIGGFQRGRSPADAHFQRIVYHGGSGNCRQAEQSDDKKKGQSVLFHKTSQWRIP